MEAVGEISVEGSRAHLAKPIKRQTRHMEIIRKELTHLLGREEYPHSTKYKFVLYPVEIPIELNRSLICLFDRGSNLSPV